jgi:hypothetical protein
MDDNFDDEAFIGRSDPCSLWCGLGCAINSFVYRSRTKD